MYSLGGFIDPRIGDKVRLRNGTSPIVVTDLLNQCLKGYYESSKIEVDWRHKRDFVYFEEQAEETNGEETMKQNQLMEVKGKERFGTYLATNSKGKLVLEMKDTNQPELFDKDDVEVVMPYTVGIKFTKGGTGNVYHYLSKEGVVEKGNIVLIGDRLDYARVVAVNTKSSTATKELKGYKVPTVEIE